MYPCYSCRSKNIAWNRDKFHFLYIIIIVNCERIHFKCNILIRKRLVKPASIQQNIRRQRHTNAHLKRFCALCMSGWIC